MEIFYLVREDLKDMQDKSKEVMFYSCVCMCVCK